MQPDSDGDDVTHVHFTARRGFIAAAGFGMVSLYLLWAGYGAAPLGFGEHGEAGEDEPAGAGGHGGGHAAADGTQLDEFRGLVQRFVDRYQLPDGSVQPRRAAAPPVAAGGHAGHGDHAAVTDNGGDAGPIDVYLMAYQFGFMPSVLRLEAGVPYRFRMMALDVAHGASLQLGPGARIVRLRPGTLVEQALTFSRPGEYLLYCTVYCGLAHDRMQGRVIVSPRRAQS